MDNQDKYYPTVRARLTELRDRIRAFDRECDAAQYTDTGGAWEIFEDIEETLADILKRSEATTRIG